MAVLKPSSINLLPSRLKDALLSVELISENNSKSEDIQNLYNLQKTFFNETDLETKQKIIKKINKSYFSIIKNEIENKISLTFEKKQKLLKSLDSFKSVNSENNYMPWQLRFFDVFLEKNGFDIIIANPPYNREKDFAEMFEPVNNSLFGKKYHSGKMNFWYYFLHKAIDKSITMQLFLLLPPGIGSQALVQDL